MSEKSLYRLKHRSKAYRPPSERVFDPVWAAQHDLAHGESDTKLEYALFHLHTRNRGLLPGPMRATLFLSAGVPAPGRIGYYLLRETHRFGTRR